jgi:hypothetical protein
MGLPTSILGMPIMGPAYIRIVITRVAIKPAKMACELFTRSIKPPSPRKTLFAEISLF